LPTHKSFAKSSRERKRQGVLAIVPVEVDRNVALALIASGLLGCRTERDTLHVSRGNLAAAIRRAVGERA